MKAVLEENLHNAYEKISTVEDDRNQLLSQMELMQMQVSELNNIKREQRIQQDDLKRQVARLSVTAHQQDILELSFDEKKTTLLDQDQHNQEQKKDSQMQAFQNEIRVDISPTRALSKSTFTASDNKSNKRPNQGENSQVYNSQEEEQKEQPGSDQKLKQLRKQQRLSTNSIWAGWDDHRQSDTVVEPKEFSDEQNSMSQSMRFGRTETMPRQNAR